MASTIAIACEKGGVTKTTTAINFAAVLAELFPEQVLLVDIDPQEGNATKACGVSVSNEQLTMYEVLLQDKRERVPAADAVIKTAHGFDMLPATRDLAVFQIDLKLQQDMSHYKRLRDSLEPLKKRYRYVIVDCPPGLMPLTLNGLTAADEVVIPVVPEFLPFDGIAGLLDTVERLRQHNINPNLRVAGAFNAKHQKNTRVHSMVRNTLRRFCEERNIPFIKAYIKSCVRFAEAPFAGIPAYLACKDEPAVQDYRQVVREIFGV